ncbi:bromodomain-containing factor 1-like [Phalaenopsis equestris]|uniref:bromodomain-containing factor 1-like n=1 Tax=Phalaenopsis equestris TaxID=78828 RepID=UPI0009E2EB69|nr:bromodomain-containing factor 1-like [Phalaenopsis equestris]
MASVEVESTPAAEVEAIPITPETLTFPESPAIAEPTAAAKEILKEIEAAQAVVDFPESEDTGAIKEHEEEVSPEGVKDAAPVSELAAEEIEEKNETEEKKEEAPTAAEAEPSLAAEEVKVPAELEGEIDTPKELEEKKADVAD